MNTAIAAILAVAVAVLAGLLLPPWLRGRRRQRALQQSLPDTWHATLLRNVPVSATLPAALARRLEGLIISFMAEKQFIGCNGLEITDEIRVTIAAQACLLLLGRAGLYDELQSILVYPDRFWVEDEVHDEDGLVTQRRRELSGEAWDSQRIILSWQDIEDSATRPADGYNVVLHEFAHYLDAEGRGLAQSSRTLEAWHEDLVGEYESLCASLDRGQPTFLDPYAAEDEVEFLAVASEEFIECSIELREAHPRLYTLLQEFYGIDPAHWAAGGHAASSATRRDGLS